MLTWPAVLVVLALSVLSACATTADTGRPRGELRLSLYGGTGLETEGGTPVDVGSPFGVSSWREPDGKEWEKAQRAEAERALESVWSVVAATESLGAEWELLFWSQGGALTLLSLQRTEEGEGALAPSSRGTFLPSLARELPSLLGNNPRRVALTLERQETGWSADLDTSSKGEPPPHARTSPSVRWGSSGLTYQQVLDTARGITRLMSVPRGGSAELVVQVSLEDGRILGWEPKEVDSSGEGPTLSAGEEAVSLVVTVLVPFTRGLGERTVSLSLQAKHRPGDARPRWGVLAAHVVEPPPLPAEVADIHQEYRRLHESIIINFQEETRELAVLVAGFTLEQIAYSIVGGLALKGAWVIIGKGAPTILSVLSKGGQAAVRWFRSLLVRTPAADREVLLRLWLKAETQGLKALSEVEKQELRAVMGRLEKVLETPLDRSAKGQLWEWARRDYFRLYHPELAKTLGAEGMKAYQVHHRCPMKYVHLFPKLDINGKANLAGVSKNVHESINAVWRSLDPVAEAVSAKDVARVIEIVNRHYRQWFDKVFDPKDLSALAAAEKSALSEVAALKSLIIP
jgi:hypothetical protein